MFTQSNSEVYVPDGKNQNEALSRTTHLCIAAHQDDIEIMAVEGILLGFENPDVHFTGCVVTDGHGSPRAGKFANVSDDEMAQIRVEEQKEAARIGKFPPRCFWAIPVLKSRRPATRTSKRI